MRDQFEIRDADGAARIGRLSVPRADRTIETPALMPVINPNQLTIEPARLEAEFGVDILITNSYIIRQTDRIRQRALDEGLHELLGFDGAIMTDSGSFQLAEYGDIGVTTAEIIRFQHDIESDIATPVDIPTPPDVSREQAEDELVATERALADAEACEVGGMLLNAPVQGSTYPDLRERAGRHAAGTDLDLFPIGAVVPLLNNYRYADVVTAVTAAKRGLDADCPVHLFGAGHPMMLALATALGCDLFDSAAYALYARAGRYLTVSGTDHLDELDYFPCSCPVCRERTPAELRGEADDRRERLLAEHNLHVTFEELRRIKQAIRSGTLFELVERRARSHPAMYDGYRALLNHADQLETTDPVSKGSFFYLSAESARRPEVRRHHRRLGRLQTPETLLVTEGGIPSDSGYDEVWRVRAPFGPFPLALADSYPLTATVPDRPDRAGQCAAADGVRALAEANPETAITLAVGDWHDDALARVPDRVETEALAAVQEREPDKAAGEHDASE